MRKKNTQTDKTVLLLAGSCAMLIIAFVTIQEWQLGLENPSPVIVPAVIITPEQQAEIFRPVRAATSSGITAAEIQAMTKPVQGGTQISDQQKAAMFRSVSPDSN